MQVCHISRPKFFGINIIGRVKLSKNYFRASIHCGKNPRMVKADPEDLVIVCGEVSVEIENQYNSEENEVPSLI